MFPRKLVRMDELQFDLSSHPTPAFPKDHPETRVDKNIQRNKNGPTTIYANNYASFLTLEGHLLQVMMILHLGFGCIIRFWSPTKNSAIHDHHRLFSRMFLLKLQRYGNKGLGQT
jgi:hypothetical protein